MIGSLFAGISGLNANSTAMTVIGDNIANVNTTAFKSNRASFANVLSQSLGGGTGSDIGRGVDFWGTTPVWSSGLPRKYQCPDGHGHQRTWLFPGGGRYRFGLLYAGGRVFLQPQWRSRESGRPCSAGLQCTVGVSHRRDDTGFHFKHPDSHREHHAAVRHDRFYI